MTHPLVSAFHHADACWRVAQDRLENGTSSSSYYLYNYEVAQQWIDELVASIPQISCFVGFLCGYNNKPYAIWLWPLKEHDLYYYWYWVDDATYDRHTPCAPGRYGSTAIERIIKPHFLRS